MKNNIILMLAGIIVLFISASCSKKAEARRDETVPVTVARVESKLIPVQINTYGTMEAYTIVPIKSLVGGQIIKVHVKSGQEVKIGDMLFSIDSRQYDATLKQVEANLERNQVLSVDAERQSKVKAELHLKKAVSEDEMFRTKAVAESLKRSVKIDEANVEKAKLDIEYCSIKSPVSGRAGDVLVDEGSVIKANDATLIVIHQIKPISVTFSIPQFHLNLLKRHILAKKINISVKPQNFDGVPVKAEFEFLDNTVDPSTGTVRLEARLDNENEEFWPGQFVNVIVDMVSEKPVLIVPSQAVQPSQKGNFVFVVKPDSTVEMRLIKIQRTVGEETGVEEGVNEGETVVTDGHIRLVPGSKIEVKGPVSSDAKADGDKKKDNAK